MLEIQTLSKNSSSKAGILIQDINLNPIPVVLQSIVLVRYINVVHNMRYITKRV